MNINSPSRLCEVQLNFLFFGSSPEAHNMAQRGFNACMTNRLFRLLLPLAFAAAAGCAGTPKIAFVAPDVQPAIERGARVLADACVQRRVLLGANHFVASASETVAQSLDVNTRAHLLRRGLATPGASAVSVCGVLNDVQDPQKTFAQVADGPTAKKAPPLKVSPALEALGEGVAGLPYLLAELQQAAQRVAAAEPKDGSATAGEAPALSSAARELAAAIAAPDDMLLFVGLQGNSESGGKIAAQMTALVGLSLAASVAAAPAALTFTGPTATQIAATNAATAGGAQFISTDGILVVGTLVDTRSGRVEWANAVTASADPMKVEAIGRGMTTDRLLLTLLNRPADQWSSPGRPANVATAAQ